MSDKGFLWEGSCDCGHQVRYTDAQLDAADNDPHLHLSEETREAGIFAAPCVECGKPIFVERTNVEVIPFSSWIVLPPPETACAECGREHEQYLPHDLQTMQYKYWFRNNEARAGREERWPTWHDAMRHCTEEVRKNFTRGLIDKGVELGPDLLADEENA